MDQPKRLKPVDPGLWIGVFENFLLSLFQLNNLAIHQIHRGD
jgi:hypothetical protein